MSTPTLRITLSGDAAPLSIAVNRTDIPPGEPGALQRWHEITPGETLALQIHPGCFITIAEKRRG